MKCTLKIVCDCDKYLCHFILTYSVSFSNKSSQERFEESNKRKTCPGTLLEMFSSFYKNVIITKFHRTSLTLRYTRYIGSYDFVFMYM